MIFSRTGSHFDHTQFRASSHRNRPKTASKYQADAGPSGKGTLSNTATNVMISGPYVVALTERLTIADERDPRIQYLKCQLNSIKYIYNIH